MQICTPSTCPVPLSSPFLQLHASIFLSYSSHWTRLVALPARQAKLDAIILDAANFCDAEVRAGWLMGQGCAELTGQKWGEGEAEAEEGG